jgi:thiol-disulfide isomerase/thioredoxin
MRKLLASLLLLIVVFLVMAQFGPSLLRGEESTPSNHRSAPEFSGISAWLNSPPLTMESLRGKVVLVQFWTYSCINCLRTLPYVTKWYDQYKDKGFVVVGVHTPEFAFERETANVERAIKRYGIMYPVAQDNQYRTWRAFDNQYWPADYLIDRSGTIVATQFGEGSYQQLENAIARLVGDRPPAADANDPDLSTIETPELYFGSDKNDGAIVDAQNPAAGERHFTPPDSVPQNRFALFGAWPAIARPRRPMVEKSCSVSRHRRSI